MARKRAKTVICGCCGHGFAETPQEILRKGERKSVLERHHIKPRAHGGKDAPDNLASVCKSCHGGVHSFYRDVAFKKMMEIDPEFFKKTFQQYSEAVRYGMD